MNDKTYSKKTEPAAASVVSAEVAESEFQRIVVEWDIDTATAHMNAESLEDYEKIRGKILRLIQAGRLVVAEDGDVTYTLRKAVGTIDTLTFSMPLGAVLPAMDRYKQNQDGRKTFHLVGDVTGQPPALFTKMVWPDANFCSTLTGFLMAS